MIVEVSPERAVEIIDKTAKFIAERRLGAPALMFLESVRPLTYIGSQMLYFIAPFANLLFKENEFEEFAAMMSERKYTDLLLKRIDELDEELNREIRETERRKRRKFWNRIKNIFKKDKNGGKNE